MLRALGFFAGGKKTITVLLFTFIIFSICPTLYTLANNINLLSIVRAVQDFAYAFIGTASLILAGLAIPRIERDRGMGTYTAFLSFGLLAGPLITTLSIPIFGISNTFHFATLVGVIGIFASLLLYRKFSAINRDWQIVGVVGEREEFKSKILAILKNRMFAIAFIGNFAFFLLFGVILVYAPLYAKDELLLKNEEVSMAFLIYYIATTSTRLSIGRIVSKVSKSMLTLLCTALSGLTIILLSLLPGILVFMAVFASLGAIQGVLFPVGSMLVAEYTHPSRRVLANSLYLMGIDIGQGIAPPITAGIAIQYGLESTFTASAVISFVAASILAFLYRGSLLLKK